MRVVSRQEIDKALPGCDLLGAIERAFVAYSNGDACIPPVAELLMEKGEVHIKYGYLKGGSHYVIKVASGFYDNPQLGLPSSNGLMMLFAQSTGELMCVLLDEGVLTDHRTAVAGVIAARYCAPETISAIGIIGTGTQAKLQALKIALETGCSTINVWGRNNQQMDAYIRDMLLLGLNVTGIESPGEVARHSNLIVTTTPSQQPLLSNADITQPTLIIAVGSDTEDKQELASDIIQQAQGVIVDSKSQCQSRGEVSHALSKDLIKLAQITELGEIISQQTQARPTTGNIVVDLTGVAVQDLAISQEVLRVLSDH